MTAQMQMLTSNFHITNIPTSPTNYCQTHNKDLILLLYPIIKILNTKEQNVNNNYLFKNSLSSLLWN